jgi:Transglycosylase SLT domain
VLVIAVLVSGLGSSSPAPPPLPGVGRPPRSGDPFAYEAQRQAAYVSRATAGSAHVLFAKSPGGVVATAARVAAFRGLVDAAVRGTSIDPNVLEGIVFVESAGRPDVIAGPDPAAAAGLTQILAQTGQSLLGMHIDLAQSRRLTAAIDGAYAAGNLGQMRRLQARRARIDDRFVPSKALAATVRYLQLAAGRLGGRSDLATVSYHMGIGNLQQVLSDYDDGHAVPYAQLFFDTAPDRHAAAYRLLSGFGDDSWLYYWRVLGAEQIMQLYRGNRGALARLSALQNATASGSEVLHPPDQTPSFADPDALSAAYAGRSLLPLPSNATALGLSYDPSMGSLARRVGAPAALYRGLRAPAVDLLIELAARVRAIARMSVSAGLAAPLLVTSTVTDARYQRALGVADRDATTGYSFQIARRYLSHAQAEAFQAMLDRLQALNLIAWARTPETIDITVASDADSVIVSGV